MRPPDAVFHDRQIMYDFVNGSKFFMYTREIHSGIVTSCSTQFATTTGFEKSADLIGRSLYPLKDALYWHDCAAWIFKQYGFDPGTPEVELPGESDAMSYWSESRVGLRRLSITWEKIFDGSSCIPAPGT